MHKFPESAAQNLATVIGDKNIENVSVKIGKSGDVLIRYEQAQFEKIKALVDTIKVNGESVDYTINE